MKKFFNSLLKNKLIKVAEPSQSYGAPVFTIKATNPNDFLPRIIVDMRSTNSCVETGATASMPDYKTLLEKQLIKGKYLTVLDMKKMYYSILVDEKSLETGAFNVLTSFGCYTFLRAITGFSIVPAYVLQTFLKYIHLDENGIFDYIANLLIFMDDITIVSDIHETLESHLEKVEKVLKRLRFIGVKLSPDKAKIAIDLDKDSVDVLGFTIKNRKIFIPDKKMEGLKNLGESNTLKKMQVLLGKLNFYRSLFPLKLHGALNILYKKLSPFTYDKEAMKAFESVKNMLGELKTNVSFMTENSVNILFCRGRIM